ncbi:OmpA family protein (plasmid) [Aristophania vespae]|uniref:OmpA family protein n=1 Tax=Aristophania vespae TaxID=2697033 RepID=A0A6P1NFZ1_9PROT|nr:flagellar motor protein MotB [Aristophania vespae]QHI96489.1 OmpA family protein [Aristophania vespae]UMM64824.1 hypothetical protein DM15PD_18440 [Aristophania vespae]
MPNKKNSPTIIIRRDAEEEASSHGGAWKIAYADFMTAMMTFFLLMWLLSITTDEQRHGIAKFFNPMADKMGAPSAFIHASPKASPVPSKNSAPIIPNESKDAVSPEAGMKKPALIPPMILPEESNDISQGIKAHIPPRVPAIIPLGGPKSGGAEHVGRIGQSSENYEGEAFKEDNNIKERIAGLKNSLQKEPKLAPLQDNLTFQVGSDEIRVEMRDTNQKSMFDKGAVVPNKYGVSLLTEIAKWLSTLPENISIIGETDSQPYRKVKRKTGILSNWTLSEIRADKAREVLVKAGYPDRKIVSVIGRADRNLAIPDKPESPGNRRIVLVIHRRKPLPVSFLSTEKTQSSVDLQNTHPQ